MQTLDANRLNQIIQGLSLEGLQCVFTIGGGEDHHRCVRQLCQAARSFQATNARHANIQQDDIGSLLLLQRQRRLAVRRFTHRGNKLQPGQQVAQALPRQGLIIHHHQFHTGSSRGRVKVTTNSPSLCSCSRLACSR